MAQIEKRRREGKDGEKGPVHYRVRYTDAAGKARSQTFRRLDDARAFASTTEADLVRGMWIDPEHGKQTFAAFANEWAAAQAWKDTSRESWPGILARLDPLIGGMPLSAIDQLVLKGARIKLSARYARTTTTLTMAYAGMVMRAAHVSGRIPRDPTKGLKPPKARADEDDGRVGPDQVPTRAEALAILSGAPAAYRAGVALGIAGLRVGEVLGMSVDRLDLERRTVTVDRQLQRLAGKMVLTTPKSEKVRTIKVPGFVAVELRRHVRDHQGDGFLFRAVRSRQPMRRDQWYGSAWRPALAAAELAEDRFVFHSLRHFCASTLLAEGAPLTAVAGHLGDTVETVSRTYVHWLRDDRDVPAAILDRFFAPAEDAEAAGE
jgi:integrase